MSGGIVYQICSARRADRRFDHPVQRLAFQGYPRAVDPGAVAGIDGLDHAFDINDIRCHAS